MLNMVIRISKRKDNVKLKEERYNQYQEAWERINKAIDKGFYLEAITIQESIITDRLISHLKGIGENFRDKNGKEKEAPSFSELINRAKSKDKDNLFIDLDEWRKKRNKAIHRIVRIRVDNIENFLQEAKECAEGGKKLAREITGWHKKEKAKSKKKVNVI